MKSQKVVRKCLCAMKRLMIFFLLMAVVRAPAPGSMTSSWPRGSSRICFMLSIDIAEKAKTDAMDAMDKALNG